MVLGAYVIYFFVVLRQHMAGAENQFISGQFYSFLEPHQIHVVVSITMDFFVLR